MLTDTKFGDGIEVWINLKEEEMVKFERDKELLHTLEYDISQFVHWVGTIRAKINYVSAFCCWQYSQFLIPLYAASSLVSSIKFLLVHKNKK